MNETRTGSLNPDDAKVGGGFLDDADVVIDNVRYVIYDFQGKGKPRLCLRLTLEGATYPEYLPIGWPTDYAPSEDGKRAVAVSDKSGKFKATDPGMRFISSAVESGFPKEQIGDDASVFDGLSCHVTRVPDDNYKPKAGAPAPKRVPSVLLVTKILALPGEREATEAEALSTIESKARDVIAKLTKQAGKVGRKDLFQLIMKELPGDPDLNAIIQTAYTERFLERSDMPWGYDRTTDVITESDEVAF